MSTLTTTIDGEQVTWKDRKRYLWLLGLVSSYTIGGFIHILLVVAVVMILVRFISGRKQG